MPSLQKFMVLATASVGAFAASSSDCTTDITIDSVNPTFDCDTIDAKVTVSPSLQGTLQIDGPKVFKQDFIVSNATGLLGISSSSLTSIGGQFLVEDCTLLNSITLSKLNKLNQLTFRRLGQLNSVDFASSGVSQASSVDIADTFLSDISGLNLATVESLTINNNRRLTKFDSNLVNITKTLIITNNGNDMQVNLTQLQTAYEIQVSNIKGLGTPALKEIQNGIKFDTNPNLVSYEAGNLTSVGTSKSGGSVSFINNAKLMNISFPVLKTVSGDLTIVNNTKLDEITGFPMLQSVENMLLGGNFENAELPKLDDVKGTINVKSTSNLTDVCKFFNGLKGKVVQGKVNCAGGLDNKTANDQNGLNKTGSNGNSGAGSPSFSTAAIFLGLIAGAAQLL
ncbi:GPI-anchored cell wall organization protein Ecm33 [Cordyceps fumosorosea ARSEF 2679]|uniref:GPI-anchored cell wall organization protein Ecm33 n=1 Tax=Cordyceps fumosorosea (strain ARSEF 2679) TaxID=1081104 RepID=A0A167R3L8_CORFA|nr:GPI-anchored cell wall organization protein Ecm33 [Cordyceps fumosorosea ARSEF 2679]OAA58241.1 GPI-anchored cell wall organization protein Ecm33 [Cordyceps fumosorosea ARSEF 2679]